MQLKATSTVLMMMFSVACVVTLPKHAMADMATIRSSDNAIWGAVGAAHLDYREKDDTATTLDTERGWMPSIAAGASVLGGAESPSLPDNLYLALDGEETFGSIHYKGALQDGTPYQGNTAEQIFALNGRVGYGIAASHQVMLIPFGEMGFRYWDRNLGSYIEDYKNFDIMAGLMAQYSPAPQWIFTVSGAGGSTFAANMVATNPTMNFDLGSGAMWKVGGKVGYLFTPRMEIFGNLDYTQLNYGHSGGVINPNDNLVYYEPNSQTQQMATRIGLAYHWQ